MARNRQRAKQRKTRARQQAQAQNSRTKDPFTADHRPTTEPPESIEEASGAAEIAKASEIPLHEPADTDEHLSADEVVAEEHFEDGQGIDEITDDGERAEDNQLEVGSVTVAGESADLGKRGGTVRAGAELPRGGNRFFNFLRACWAELQRVQWPDRRAVAQATGVVLGFVVIAGGYLGLMDVVAQRVIDVIL